MTQKEVETSKDSSDKIKDRDYIQNVHSWQLQRGQSTSTTINMGATYKIIFDVYYGSIQATITYHGQTVFNKNLSTDAYYYTQQAGYYTVTVTNITHRETKGMIKKTHG
jgi:hypothetical protein